MKTPTAQECEPYLISIEDWNEAPPQAQKVAQESHAVGIPTGIAFHPDYGWCVLMSGQGPYFAWKGWDGGS